MASLRDLQTEFRLALLDDADHRIADAIVPDRPGALARVAIYRHHVLTSLTAALEATFPVVCRLVDRRFFGWLADRFVRAHPPTGPCLVEYGGDLPAFIDGFPACAHLPWLGDVARLEWTLNAVLHAPNVPALTPEMLGAIASSAMATRVLRLHPAVMLLASRWPIDTIWRANQPGAAALTVDLDAGGVELEIRRDGDDIVFRRLPPSTFAFRGALAAGHPLGAAVEAALAIDPTLHVATAIRALLDERVIAAD